MIKQSIQGALPRAADRGASAPLHVAVAQEAFRANSELLASLETTPAGLDEEQIEARLHRDGINEVSYEKPPHWSRQLLRAFKNPFIIVLLVLAVVQMFATPDDLSGPIIIAAMVGISVLLSFTQEYRSSKAAEKLKAMVRNTATVTRRASDGHSERIEVPVGELVAGDIVHLAAGDMVPADLRLLHAKDLFISQAILTGESLPVEKAAPGAHGAAEADHANPLDLPTICYMGTNVVSGTATAVAVATGPRSYLGSLAHSIVGQRVQTSFDRGVNSVSWLLIRFMAVMVPVVFLINGFDKHDWLQAFMFALSVAVGLTPEMLPLIVTANLAKGALAMSRRKVVVKRLNAIQNFGAMDVLCTDKTGTLTLDKIVLERHLDLHGEESDEALEYGYLNSRFQTGLKNLMDKAVLAHRDLEPAAAHYRIVDEIPFDFQRRRMSVVLGNGDGHDLIVCKGAVEEMLSICTWAKTGDQIVPMTDAQRDEIKEMTRGLNEDGLRVLVVAVKQQPPAGRPYGVADESGLTAVGCLAFLDPPKDSAATAIAALHHHGVQVKVITGDNEAVTRKICREVGLDVEHSAQGRQIEPLDDAALDELVKRTTVFAKMSPLQKARVVKSLQRQGHTVGFLGDGINDAPALREADVGISVDTATDIAKESADIILLEKNLMVLEEGVIEGRITFGNIIKYIKMTASSNFGNMFSVLVASAFLPFLPMLPLQILVLNLLYDISQLSIPFDRMDDEYLRKPRKWDASDIGRFMVWIGPVSSIFDITTFLLLWHVFGANSMAHQPFFQSGWFIESLLTQTLIVHMIRTRRIPFLQSIASAPVLALTTAVILIGLFVPFTGLGAKIGMVALPPAFFGWVALTVLTYGVLTQLMKLVYIRRYGRWL
ncbi:MULTISPECIES: magnesium-translocating P-type ATPase [Rhodanobacter]|uniref:Magnesium-transporting ATPase, P-type 1 n=1 Tax=Rhodanobacter denitrificans TaxID=666685 RepID=M4NI34_9GAMM|nr:MULTISPECIES: magnesium-translocating P-type ATPase [Rhodanobacter]AGG87461.1 magnesium-translocating P-type ATPase [Rhodanobacter denitrificans]UJJ51378.1 magnesium-translocating P-type ATPase [Rhodanobacter denitrificans]UJM86641.1 magnesium-translocating P-type ATPase [Rhodanobacter denitrificans]UJM94125.1 magnesium-translocating P-type ATPase [Rhodanobacter denitrificans]UJM97654.1 magnesium-translocating P-type ATPase [Rhodanobacter denitrificans]